MAHLGHHSVDKSFFLEWTDNLKVKIDERMSHLTNKSYTNKHRDFLSSTDVKKALDNIHRDFVLVPVDFMPLLLLENWDWTITHLRYLQQCRGLSANDIIDEMIWHWKTKWGIDSKHIVNILIS